MLPVSLLPAAGGQLAVLQPALDAHGGAGEVWELLPRVLGQLGRAAVLVRAPTHHAAVSHPQGVLFDAFTLIFKLLVCALACKIQMA